MRRFDIVDIILAVLFGLVVCATVAVVVYIVVAVAKNGIIVDSGSVNNIANPANPASPLHHLLF